MVGTGIFLFPLSVVWLLAPSTLLPLSWSPWMTGTCLLWDAEGAPSNSWFFQLQRIPAAIKELKGPGEFGTWRSPGSCSLARTSLPWLPAGPSPALCVSLEAQGPWFDSLFGSLSSGWEQDFGCSWDFVFDGGLQLWVLKC